MRVPEVWLCERGDVGKGVRIVQELLCLVGLGLKLDGDFGPATEAAVKTFQSTMKQCLDGKQIVSGAVDAQTGVLLLRKFRRMAEPSKFPTYRERIEDLMTRATCSGIREVGGQNRGPWVRFFMGGEDMMAWCAAFATELVVAAGAPLSKVMWNCNDIAAWAEREGRMTKPVAVGDLFLVPHAPGTVESDRRRGVGFAHVGIVAEVFDGQVIRTVEGNSNDEGSPEGYEVACRFRAVSSLRFVSMGQP